MRYLRRRRRRSSRAYRGPMIQDLTPALGGHSGRANDRDQRRAETRRGGSVTTGFPHEVARAFLGAWTSHATDATEDGLVSRSPRESVDAAPRRGAAEPEEVVPMSDLFPRALIEAVSAVALFPILAPYAAYFAARGVEVSEEALRAPEATALLSRVLNDHDPARPRALTDDLLADDRTISLTYLEASAASIDARLLACGGTHVRFWGIDDYDFDASSRACRLTRQAVTSASRADVPRTVRRATSSTSTAPTSPASSAMARSRGPSLGKRSPRGIRGSTGTSRHDLRVKTARAGSTVASDRAATPDDDRTRNWTGTTVLGDIRPHAEVARRRDPAPRPSLHHRASRSRTYSFARRSRVGVVQERRAQAQDVEEVRRNQEDSRAQERKHPRHEGQASAEQGAHSHGAGSAQRARPLARSAHRDEDDQGRLLGRRPISEGGGRHRHSRHQERRHVRAASAGVVASAPAAEHPEPDGGSYAFAECSMSLESTREHAHREADQFQHHCSPKLVTCLLRVAAFSEVLYFRS